MNPVSSQFSLMGPDTLRWQQSQWQEASRVEKQLRDWNAKKDVTQRAGNSADKLVAEHAKLQKAAKDLEGVFVQQLLTAMDKTVDRSQSLMGGGQAEGMFREMMYEKMATDIAHAPGGSGFGMADTIYRQLSAHLPALPKASVSESVTLSADVQSSETASDADDLTRHPQHRQAAQRYQAIANQSMTHQAVATAEGGLLP